MRRLPSRDLRPVLGQERGGASRGELERAAPLDEPQALDILWVEGKPR